MWSVCNMGFGPESEGSGVKLMCVHDSPFCASVSPFATWS